jgi:RND family efflux transporter MFP subunit
MAKYVIGLSCCLLATLLTTCLLLPRASGEEKKPSFLGPAAPEELQVLASLVGKWSTKTESRPSLESKEALTASGEAAGQLLHNGHFIRLEGTIDSKAGRTEYTLLMTYDRKQKVYRRWAFTSAGVAAASTGEWDEAARTMTWTATQGNVTTLIKQVLEKDRFVESHLFKRDDGTITRDLTFTAERKKPAEGALGAATDDPAGTSGPNTPAAKAGDSRVVQASGRVEAKELVDVGAQVAGRIEKILVEHGAYVRAGDILAQINARPYEIEVERARAGVERAQARLSVAKAKTALARGQLERLLKLEPKAINEAEIEAGKAELEVAGATVRLEEAGIEECKAILKRAELDLSYCAIRSPIEGMVLDHRCHLGQAVSASLDAPSLFVLAKDLKAMRLLASVKEEDIVRVAAGQTAKFQVDALPEETFEGRVSQIRLQGSTSKVKAFTVVIDVENRRGKLLPSMTAHVKIAVDERP